MNGWETKLRNILLARIPYKTNAQHFQSFSSNVYS